MSFSTRPSTNKLCSGCGHRKPASTAHFYAHKKSADGLSWECKDCAKARSARTYAKDPERGVAKSRNWRLANPERAAEGVVRRAKCPLRAEAHRESNRRYKLRKGEAYHAARRERERARWISDAGYRVGKVVAHQIRKAIRGDKAGRRWEVLVGYSADDLIRHLERQFTKGMSWENYGEGWHIDHIRPVASFDFSQEGKLKECWALPNLRPLPADQNRAKGAKRLLLV